MVTITLRCAHCNSENIVRNGLHQTVNSAIYVTTVVVRVAIIHRAMLTRRSAGMRSCALMRNAAVCVGSLAPLTFHAIRSTSWIKKGSTVARVKYNPNRTRHC